MITATENRWAHLMIAAPSGCWIWVGTRDRYGYAKWSGKKAHRLLYAAAKGPITTGLTIDHLCRVRRCVNPLHLDAVTKTVNDLRGNAFSGVNARKTRCVNGHEFTPDNTYIWRQRRHCRTCRRTANQKAA